MTKFIEVGHSKNVANFEDLISFCIAYGSAYDPINTNITIAALQAKHSTALADIQALKTAKTALDNATNARELVFAPCRALATRIIASLSVISPSKLTIEDAKTINRKIQGRRSKSIKKESSSDKPDSLDGSIDPADNSISISQQSYDSLLDHFLKLKETVSQEPLYLPNEADLSVAAITSLITAMQSANTGVISATTVYSNAKIVRDKTLYDASTGLLPISLEVKLYVKSLFGASSPQFKQVSKLKFRV